MRCPPVPLYHLFRLAGRGRERPDSFVRVPGAAQHLKGVYALLRGLWWCAADTDLGFTRDRRPNVRKSGKPDLRGPLRYVAVPDQRCIALLMLAPHRIRDTLCLSMNRGYLWRHEGRWQTHAHHLGRG